MDNMDNMASNAVSRLAPVQRFMYEYGCFMTFWGNFELYMETAIWHLRKKVCGEQISRLSNCREINTKMAGCKRNRLNELLKCTGRQDAIDAVNAVFDVADRNGWVHGHILNPNYTFERFTKFRVIKKKGQTAQVENKPVKLDPDSFASFYTAYLDFENMVTSAFGIGVNECNDYITKVQVEQAAENQPQPTAYSTP